MRIYDATIDETGMLGVNAISLVEYPAIEANFVALSKQEILLQKFDEARQMLFGPVLIPDQLILRRDEEGDYYIRYSKEVIQQAAYDFIKKNRQHNHTVEHSMAINSATVVETWIKEGESDKSVQLGFDLPVGTWFVGTKVDDPKMFELAKTGALKGFSIEGFFDMKQPIEQTEQKILEGVKELLSSLNPS
jgi:Putative phage serine protease XkdF